jgi:hypothetical protein
MHAISTFARPSQALLRVARFDDFRQGDRGVEQRIEYLKNKDRGATVLPPPDIGEK